MIRLLLLCAGLLAAAAAGEQLVPWRQMMLNDANGMRWDINADGEIGRGQNNVVNQANTCNIDGNGCQISVRQMTADGRTAVFGGQIGSLQLVRRVRLDPATGTARWVELLRNPDGQPRTVNFSVFVHFPYGYNAIVSDGGGNGQGLGAKDQALGVASQHQQIPSVALGLAHARARLRPTVQVDQNNQSIQTTWRVTVPARGSLALVHCLAMRQGPIDATALKALVRTWQERTFLADLPAEVRRAVANWGGGGGGGEVVVGAPRAIPGDLVPAAGDPETLVLGGDSRLRGSSQAERLAIVTPRGRIEVPYARVAAIGGGQGLAAVFLRDGQVLAGRIEGTLRFTLVSGLATSLSPDRLQWLVRCGLDRESPRLLIGLSDGQVVAAEAGERQLPFATCWGRLDLPLAEVRALTAQDDGTLAVSLRDGSRVIGQLAAPLELGSEWFGALRLAPTEVRAIGRLEKPREDQEQSEGLTATHLRLLGDQVLVGELALERLRLMTVAGEVPLLPGQIRRLSLAEADDAGPGSVAVELWGGDAVTGRLQVRRLPLKVHGTLVQAPLEDLVELVVPTPEVPPETRERIATLVRDLGDPQWERREEASKALAVLGALAKPALEAAVAAGDPEVRQRAEALLQALK